MSASRADPASRARVLRRVALGVGAGVLLALLAGGVALYALGLRGLADYALARVASEHHVDAVQWLGDGVIEVRGLRLRGDTWAVSAANMRAKVRLASLGTGTVHLDTLAVDRLDVRADTRGPGAPRALHLPGLRIDDVRIARADVEVDDTRLALEGTRAALTLADTTVHARALDTRLLVAGERIAFARGDLVLRLDVPRHVAVAADWVRERRGGEASGHARLAGPFALLQGVVRLDAPLRTRAAVAYGHGVLGLAVPRLALGSTALDSLVARLDLRARPWALRATTRASVPALGRLQVAVDSAWTGGVMPVRARVLAGPNAAALTGTLDPGSWALALRLDGEGIDAAHWLSGARSRLHLRGSITAHVLPPLRADVALDADGTLLNRPVEGDVRLALDGSGVRVHSASLRNAGNRLDVQPDGDGWRGLFALHDLRTLSTALAGSIDGTARLRARQVQLDLRGAALRAGPQVAVRTITLRGEASLDARVNLHAEATGLRLATLELQSLRASAVGTPARHRIDVAGVGAEASFEAAADGAYTPARARAAARWRGTLRDARLAAPRYGQWAQRAPATIELGRGFAHLGGLCLDGSAGSRLCAARADYDGRGPRAQGAFNDLPLALLPLPRMEVLQLEGRVDGSFAVDPARVRGDAHVHHTEATLNGRRIAIETGQVHVDWPLRGTGAARLSAQVASSTLGTLDGAIARTPAGALTGRIDAALKDLGYVQALLTGTRAFYLEGHADARLTLSGTDAAPHLGGEGQVEGTLRVPRVGPDALPLTLSLRGADTRVRIDGKAAGLDVAGTLGLDRLTEPTLEARITGRAVPVLKREDLAATISPDLQVAYARGFANVSGKVHLDAADVRFVTDDARRGGLSDDVVIHPPIDPRAPPPRARAAPENPLRWAADIAVTLGDAVKFSAAGLRTRLTGALRVQARPPAPMRVLGYVNAVDGSFDAYGVKLALDRGRLDFDGPADNPRVDARAVRKLDETGNNLVGVRITGPLQRMQTTLFSEPARNAEDTLALLVTGQTLTGGDTANLQAVGQAGLALGVLKALPVTGYVRDTLGLDELEVRDPLDRTQSRISVGKQITKRLRARYVYNVFNRSGGVQLRYQVTNQISLQTEASAETSAIDVLWEWRSD